MLVITYHNKMLLIYILVLVIFKLTNGLDLQTFTVCKDHYANSRIQEKWNTNNAFYCYFYCGRNSWCRAVSVKRDPGNVKCTFHEGMFDVNCNSFPLMDKENYRLLLKNEEYVPANDNGCLNGGTYDNGTCLCRSGFAGDHCERYVYDCKEAKETNVYLPSGFITGVLTKPTTSSEAFESFCNNAGSTVILIRTPVEYNLLFNRTWEEYKYAFGKDFNIWMGLERLHQVSQIYGTTRRLQVYCNVPGDQFSVYYHSFEVADESQLYRATVSSDTKNANKDSIGTPNEQPFCTYDKPCNGRPNTTKAGWWYVDTLEQYALTNPADILLCKRNGNDAKAVGVSIEYRM